MKVKCVNNKSSEGYTLDLELGKYYEVMGLIFGGNFFYVKNETGLLVPYGVDHFEYPKGN